MENIPELRRSYFNKWGIDLEQCSASIWVLPYKPPQIVLDNLLVFQILRFRILWMWLDIEVWLNQTYMLLGTMLHCIPLHRRVPRHFQKFCVDGTPLDPANKNFRKDSLGIFFSWCWNRFKEFIKLNFFRGYHNQLCQQASQPSSKQASHSASMPAIQQASHQPSQHAVRPT